MAAKDKGEAVVPTKHGHVPTYKKGCRCGPCTAANTEYHAEYRRRVREGRPTTNLVDAGPVRAHVQALMALGATRRQIMAAAGVEEGFVTNLLVGAPSKGKGPARRVSPRSARLVLALPLEPSVVVGEWRVPPWSTVCGDPIRRRARALYALGYSPIWQAEQIGMSTGAMRHLIATPGRDVAARFAARLRDLYARVSSVRPEGPEADAARAAATARGWTLVPADWDDDFMDLSDAAMDKALTAAARRMGADELAHATTSYGQGDRSALTVVAAREHRRRRRVRARERTAAA